MIITAYLILAGLLLWSILNKRGKWYLKSAAVVGVIGFSLLMYGSFNSYMGWPLKASHAPANSLYISGIVNEPDQVNNDPGNIILWMIPGKVSSNLFYYRPSDRPRSYILPYTAPLAKAIQGIQGRIAREAKKQKGQIGTGIILNYRHGHYSFKDRHIGKLPPKH